MSAFLGLILVSSAAAYASPEIDDGPSPPPAKDWCPTFGQPEETADVGGDKRSLPPANCMPLSQKSCGGCYAFSITEQLSARILLNGAPESIQKFKKDPVLSAEAMISFYYWYDQNDSGGDSYLMHGCAGGNLERAGRLIMEHGVPTVGCAPQLDVTRACFNKRGGKDGDGWPRDCFEDGCTLSKHLVEGKCWDAKGKVTSASWSRYGKKTFTGAAVTDVVLLNGEQDIIQDLNRYGPISVSIRVWDNYRDCKPCDFVDAPTNTDKSHGLHDVLVVGYGTTKDNIPYWKIRDSHGPDRGIGGFVRVRRNIPEFDLEKNAVSLIISNKQEMVEEEAMPSLRDNNNQTDEEAPRLPVGLLEGGWYEAPMDDADVQASARAVVEAWGLPNGTRLLSAHAQDVQGRNVRLLLRGPGVFDDMHKGPQDNDDDGSGARRWVATTHQPPPDPQTAAQPAISVLAVQELLNEVENATQSKCPSQACTNELERRNKLAKEYFKSELTGFTDDVGPKKKFGWIGEVQPKPGYSIIANVAKGSANRLDAGRQLARSSHAAEVYLSQMLPLSSLHMTVFSSSRLSGCCGGAGACDRQKLQKALRTFRDAVAGSKGKAFKATGVWVRPAARRLHLQLKVKRIEPYQPFQALLKALEEAAGGSTNDQIDLHINLGWYTLYNGSCTDYAAQSLGPAETQLDVTLKDMKFEVPLQLPYLSNYPDMAAFPDNCGRMELVEGVDM